MSPLSKDEVSRYFYAEAKNDTAENAQEDELLRLRASHAALLAAAKGAIALADKNCTRLPDGTWNRTNETQAGYDAMVAAIALAEENVTAVNSHAALLEAAKAGLNALLDLGASDLEMTDVLVSLIEAIKP